MKNLQKKEIPSKELTWELLKKILVEDKNLTGEELEEKYKVLSNACDYGSLCLLPCVTQNRCRESYNS